MQDSEIRLREEIAALEAANRTLREERDLCRTAGETYAPAIDVLTVENGYPRRGRER